MSNTNILYRDPKILEILYWKEGLSLRQIAKKFGTSDVPIRYWMKKNNIPHRPCSNIKRFEIAKGVLENLYLKEKLNTIQIAEKFNVSYSTVRNKLIKYDVPIRSKSERMTKYPKRYFSGNLKEKAYMIGLRAGDINAYRHFNLIRIQTASTHPAQIKMVKNVFGKYSHIGLSTYTNNHGKEWCIYSDLDDSFSFLIIKSNEIPKWILSNNELFFCFLASYIDCEGNLEIAKSNENDVRFIFRIRSYDKIILKQIKNKLEKLGLKVNFFLDKKEGSYTTFGKLKKDFYGIRIYRKTNIIKLINVVLSLSHHDEKIRKMNFILENKDRKWNEIKDKIVDLRNEIKKEVINEIIRINQVG